MSDPIRTISYGSREDEFNDSFAGDIFNFVYPHALRATVVAAIISAPIFVGGFLFAPQGTSRLEHGTELVGRQHQFLWHYGRQGAAVVWNGVTGTFNAINDNGSSK